VRFQKGATNRAPSPRPPRTSVGTLVKISEAAWVPPGYIPSLPGCIPSPIPCVHALLHACSAAPACVLRCSRLRPGPGPEIPAHFGKIWMGLCCVRALLRAFFAACVLRSVRAPLRACSAACVPGLLAWTANPGSLGEDGGHVSFCACSAAYVLRCVRAHATPHQNPNTTNLPRHATAPTYYVFSVEFTLLKRFYRYYLTRVFIKEVLPLLPNLY